MRYLVTWKTLPVTPEMTKTALALLEATETWIEEEKQAGRIIEAWATSDGTGGVAICEYDSNDAVFGKLMESPYAPFLQYTVTPLTDLKLALGTFKKALKKMAGE